MNQSKLRIREFTYKNVLILFLILLTAGLGGIFVGGCSDGTTSQIQEKDDRSDFEKGVSFDQFESRHASQGEGWIELLFVQHLGITSHRNGVYYFPYRDHRFAKHLSAFLERYKGKFSSISVCGDSESSAFKPKNRTDDVARHAGY